jgi:hypothetical protein
MWLRCEWREKVRVVDYWCWYRGRRGWERVEEVR